MVALVIAGLVGPPVTVSAGDNNVRLRSGAMRGTVQRALEGAARRLERPACTAILDEFADASGRTLREKLGAKGVTAPVYLERVLFYDGYRNGRCQAAGVLASTVPDASVVLVCARFYEQAGHDPRLAEIVLIHEALHTLGLGENPPSSVEITARVLKRCH